MCVRVYALTRRTIAGPNCSEGVLRPRQPREAGPVDRCFSFFFAYIGKKSTQRSFLFVYYTDDFDTCDLIVVLIATQMIINRV